MTYPIAILISSASFVTFTLCWPGKGGRGNVQGGRISG